MDISTNTPEERKAFLSERARHAKASQGATSRVEIEGKVNILHHFSVPIGFPLYRLENGRTQRKQREYLHQHPENPELFIDSQFENEAQRVQGEILESMASENKLDELLTDGQKEPLLLTSIGYVLNGNRRLATLRMMRRSANQQDVTKGYVDVVVLPDLSQKELSAIETRLQMSEEGKAPYHWLDQLLKIEHDITEFGLEEIEIARQMNVKTPTIKTLRSALTLVDSYLERRGWATQYFRVDEQKQAFETLAKKYRSLDGSPELQLSLLDAAFAVMEEPPKGKSVHVEITEIAKHIQDFKVPHTFSDSNRTEVKKNGSDDIVSQMAKTVGSVSPTRRVSTAESVREQLIIAKEKVARGDIHNLPNRNAKEANALISAIQITKESTQQKQVKGQLQGVVKKANELIQQLENLAKDNT